MFFIRQNMTGKLRIGPFVDVTDGATMETGVTLSGADSATALLSDDTTVDISGYTWAAITGSDGYYSLTAQTGFTDTPGYCVIQVQDVSVCLPVRNEFYILEEAIYDALFAASAAAFDSSAYVKGVTGTAHTLDDLNDISVADVLTTQMTEAYAANGTAPTLAQAMFAMHQMLMQFAVSGTSYTVKKLDNSTTAFVVTLNDATSPTAAVRT